MTTPPSSPWTDERVKTLRRMWRDGCSAPDIAAKLGGGLSANACIGKARRLGLGEHANAPRIRVQTGRKHTRRPKPWQPPTTGETVTAAPAPPVRLQEPIAPPTGKPITLMQLRDGVTRKDGTIIPGTCKWPIGDPRDPGFGFCGMEPDTGTPYCLYHARIAYQPRKSREYAA